MGIRPPRAPPTLQDPPHRLDQVSPPIVSLPFRRYRAGLPGVRMAPATVTLPLTGPLASGRKGHTTSGLGAGKMVRRETGKAIAAPQL